MSTVTVIDYGGSIAQEALHYASLAASGVMFKIKLCASACVMAFAHVPHDQVCYYQDAWIGTHTAAMHPDETGRCCTESPTTMHWQRGRDFIADGYAEC